MATRFPFLSSRPLPVDRRELAGTLARLSMAGVLSGAHGYVRLSSPTGDGFLFIANGKSKSAGRLQNGLFLSEAIGDFFDSASYATQAELCLVDLEMLHCMEVLFRKPPSTELGKNVASAELLLGAIRWTKKDAALAVLADDGVSFVFCSNGVPVSLYPADGEPFRNPASGVTDRVMSYLKDKREAGLDFYDDIPMSPAEGAGRPFESFMEAPQARTTVPSDWIVVRMGSRMVFRYPAVGSDRSEISIGRGRENAIPLDNISVSRKHAVIRRDGGKVFVQDLGSENGLLVNGARVDRVQLGPGVEVAVGNYTLLLASSVSAEVPLAGPIPGQRTQEHAETMVVPSNGPPPPYIEHDGKQHRIGGLAFDIGSSPDAHLMVRGLFVAARHVRIVRLPDGSYRAERLGGIRGLKVNGEVCKQAPLKSGDELILAGHRLRFVQPGGSTTASIAPLGLDGAAPRAPSAAK